MSNTVNNSNLVYFKQLDGLTFFGKYHSKVKSKMTWFREFDKSTNKYTGKCKVVYNGEEYIRTRDELHKYLVNEVK